MNDTLVAEALRAHWTAEDETVTTVGFSAAGLRRRARRRTATVRVLVLACVALVATGVVSLTRPGRHDAAPAAPLATLVTSDGWTLTLRQEPDRDAPSSGPLRVVTSLCTTGHGKDLGCSGAGDPVDGSLGDSMTLGEVAPGSLLDAGLIQVHGRHQPIDHVAVSVDGGPARRVPSATSADGGVALFAVDWAAFGLTPTTRPDHLVTVIGSDAAGADVFRMDSPRANNLLQRHPGRHAEVTLPGVDGVVSVWETDDGQACRTSQPDSPQPSADWCGPVHPGTTALGWIDGDVWGLLLHVPSGTRSVQVGDQDAVVHGVWASVPGHWRAPGQAQVTLTGADGQRRAVGTVAGLNSPGLWAADLALAKTPPP